MDQMTIKRIVRPSMKKIKTCLQYFDIFEMRISLKMR